LLCIAPRVGIGDGRWNHNRVPRTGEPIRATRSDLLALLLGAAGNDVHAMGDASSNEAMTIFLAGHEITALALTWA
jgi:cytochrome P450